MLSLKPRRIGTLIREGDGAQRRQDWPTAYRCYAEIVAIRPDQVEIWIQLGHVAKEIGKINEAETAYREALQRGGGNPDISVELGDLLLRQGRRGEAILFYSDALQVDPDAIAPFLKLVSLGARDAIPDAVFALPRREQVTKELASRKSEMEALEILQAEMSIAAPRHYDTFRRTYPVPKPPPLQSAPATCVVVLLDARDAPPASLRATLISLLDQSSGYWQARVRPSPGLLDHPVASFGVTEPRITFLDPIQPVSVGSNDWIISVPAGTMLDPECLAWLIFAASIVETQAIFADHDHLVDDPIMGRSRSDPHLFAAFDPYMMAQVAEPPPVVMIQGKVLAENDGYLELPAIDMHRRVLLSVNAPDAVSHIPRFLSSVVEMSDAVRNAPHAGDLLMPIAASPMVEGEIRTDHGAEALRVATNPTAVATPLADIAELRIIIPSRDEAPLLRTSVNSLFECATRRNHIRVTIVDNRSSDPDAIALLEEYRRCGIDVLVMNEPFNWSRANNLAVAASREPYLTFVNNDTVMLTQDWDQLLLGLLKHDDIGVVGARLLYPDLTLQHGGAIFLAGSPRHEGVGAAEHDPGPLGRWMTTRIVSAVTGAFLAVRRDRFEAVGGFDERRLAIAFNDIDFCLKIRSHDWRILYSAAIQLIHHESKTRGVNDTRTKVAWDLDEFRTLRERWGGALSYDPGYNPQWADGPVPFDGWQEPSMQRIIDYVRRSAVANPWSVAKP